MSDKDYLDADYEVIGMVNRGTVRDFLPGR